MGQKANSSRNRRRKDTTGKSRHEGISERSNQSPLDWIWAMMAGLFFVLMPFVVSTAGYESFDAPKNSFLLLGIAVLAVFGLVTGRFKPYSPLNSIDLLALVCFAYILLHTLLMGIIGSNWPSVLAFFTLVVLYFILRSIPTRGFFKFVWLGIAFSMACNAVFTILQQLDMFPLMVGSGRADASDRLVPAGFIGEVNRGGFLFALTLIALLYFVFCLDWRKKGLRISAIILAASILAGLAFSRTMTSILGLSACVLLWLLFHNLYLLHKRKSPKRDLIVFWTVILVAVAGMSILAYRAGVVDRIQGIGRMVERESWTYATSGRTPLFYLTWEMIKESPVAGNGLNSFPVDFYEFKTETETGRNVTLMTQPGAFKEVHNEFLQVWLELGLPGLILLLILFTLPVYRGFRFMFKEMNGEDFYWTGIMILGLIFTAITCLAFFPLHLAVTSPYIVLLIAGLVRFTTAPREDPGYPEWLPDISGKSRLKYLLAVVLLLFAGWSTYYGVVIWKVNKQVGMASYILTRSMSEPLNPRQRMAIVREALYLLEESEGNNFQSAEIDNLKGTAYLMTGRSREAVRSFQDALKTAPSPESYVNLATAYLSLGNREGAVESLRKAQNYDIRNLKVLQFMWHIWRNGGFSREESIQLVLRLKGDGVIGSPRALRMLRDLRDRGVITSKEYSSLAARVEGEEEQVDEIRD